MASSVLQAASSLARVIKSRQDRSHNCNSLYLSRATGDVGAILLAVFSDYKQFKHVPSNIKLHN